MRLHLLYIPVPDVETGKRLARLGLEQKLAACANLHGPMVSLYEWEGEMKEEEEWVLILKTVSTQAKALSALIEEAHPYECPCIVGVPAEANAGFEEWVNNVLG
jgi:periplasmic divalent cation tolerance protein